MSRTTETHWARIEVTNDRGYSHTIRANCVYTTIALPWYHMNRFAHETIERIERHLQAANTDGAVATITITAPENWRLHPPGTTCARTFTGPDVLREFVEFHKTRNWMTGEPEAPEEIKRLVKLPTPLILESVDSRQAPAVP